MKTMIRMAMMAAVMVLAVTSVGQAQGGGGGGRGGNRVMAVLKDSMKVSEAILAKADSIKKAFNAEAAPLMEAMRGGDADARTKMTALRAKQTDAIKALLTDDQKAAVRQAHGRGPRTSRRWTLSASLVHASLHD